MKKVLQMFAVSLMLVAAAFAQTQRQRNVAIFVHEGVELLDFGGPGEVFAATSGFNVYTVAPSEDALISQRFLKVLPAYTIYNCPKPDIIVLPGGATSIPASNDDVIKWVRESAAHTEIMLSVCTGALLLSKAGLLDGKQATTWYGFIDRLQEVTPNAKILRNTRFVDNGQIVTTAGVSAGIDGALRVVTKLKGNDAARATAKYMEYDKWDPNAGLIIDNEFTAAVKKDDVDAALKAHQTAHAGNGSLPKFYEGDMLNLGLEYLEKGQVEAAVKLLELNIKAYPHSYASHKALGEVYSRVGRKELALQSYKNFLAVNQGDLEVVDKIGLAEAMKFFGKLKNEKRLSERAINALGYQLLSADRNQEAIDVFKLNVAAFPQSGNVYDSLGEAYMKIGENRKAIENYRKSLEIDPKNENAMTMLKKLSEKS
jgi:putative intracellular protease/amidase/predicted negative regulator of RcsB-dependent stress response